MTARHNDWDTSAHRGESSSSTTTSSSEIEALAQQMIKMRKDMLHMYRSNQQVNSVTPSCKTYGGPHSYIECQAAAGYTHDVHATTGTFNSGGNSYQPQGNRDLLSYRSNNFLGPPDFSNQNQDGPLVPPPPLFSFSKEVKQDSETIIDQVLTKSTIRVSPLVVQLPPAPRSSKTPLSPSSLPSELPKRNPHQPLIPYLSSLADVLPLMPKYAKMLKDLISDKEKILGLANTSLTENCSAVLLKKLPEKLGVLGKFFIPRYFPELEKCMALSDLGVNINLMPLYVWKKLTLPELIPIRMTLELTNRSVAYPASIAEDVCVQVGKFTFPADLVVVDYDLILREGDEKLIFHADSTSKHPHKHRNESINMINFIDITCEDRFQEVLKIKKSNHPLSGSTTSPSDSSPSLTPFETSDSLFEEFAAELDLLNQFPSGNEYDNFDPEANLREIEYLLNRDPSTDSSPTAEIDIIDPILERFTDEPTLIYSSSPRDDDDDPIMKNGKSFYKDSKMNSLTEAFLILEDSNFLSHSSDHSSDRELLFFLELTVTETLLSFSSENKDKVFNPGIRISKGVHSFTLGLSHRTYENFKIINVHPDILNESSMKIFPFFCFYPKDKGIRGESS
nr:reverse transcriptase domain-containing protein [Tanacetum cinerariifolium]